MGEQLHLNTSTFEEIVAPLASELTARQIDEKDVPTTSLGNVLGFSISTDSIATPFADDSLSCTNPSCECDASFNGR